MKNIIENFLLLILCFFAVDIEAQEVAIKVLDNGNVGINNATPSSKLDVKGDINTSGKVKENGTDLMPKGAVIMYHGETIPKGWVICNGDNGTPDLRGRFVVGMGKNANKKKAIPIEVEYKFEDEGGINKITLTENEIPKHSHIVDLSQANIYKWDKSFAGSSDGKQLRTVVHTQQGLEKKYDDRKEKIDPHSTEEYGNGIAFDNRPPYYALYYIMKL